MRFNENDVIQYFYKLSGGEVHAYGQGSTESESSPVTEYKPDEVMFYGF